MVRSGALRIFHLEEGEPKVRESHEVRSTAPAPAPPVLSLTALGLVSKGREAVKGMSTGENRTCYQILSYPCHVPRLMQVQAVLEVHTRFSAALGKMTRGLRQRRRHLSLSVHRTSVYIFQHESRMRWFLVS